MAFATHERRHLLAAWVLSFAAHAALSAWGASLVGARQAAEWAVPAAVVSIDVQLELPRLAVAARAAAPARPVQALTGGGAALARPDSGRAGRGGSARVSAPAVNLAPRDDEAHLSPSLRSRLERAQQARSRTGSHRRSVEDDRVTPHPMMATFVSDGRGRLLDQRRRTVRRRLRPWLEEAGRNHAQQRATVEAPARATGERTTRRRAMRSWAAPPRSEARLAPAPAPGKLAQLSPDAPAAAGTMRPQVLAGGESSPANQRGRQSDSVDAEQEVSALSPSLMRASTAGGVPGAGRGGEAGPGATGSGGRRGGGSLAAAFGLGRGPGVVASAGDQRRRRYLRSMWSRIHAAWSSRDFPQWAALQGRQGYTIVGFVVLQSGAVSAVQVTRPSGVAEFDVRMVRAVLRAAPFGPLPPELGPLLHHTHEFVINNPAVRPLRPR